MSQVDGLSRREFLLGRFRQLRSDAAAQSVPGPGAVRGDQRDFSGILSSMGSTSPVDGKPIIYSAVLNEAGLDAVFAEIESSGTQVVVRVKGSMMQMAEDKPLTVRQAKGVVRQGRGLQIRYRHDGVLWSDTYQTTPEGIKLTRCQLPADLDMPGQSPA